jgi:hypothetical protein
MSSIIQENAMSVECYALVIVDDDITASAGLLEQEVDIAICHVCLVQPVPTDNKIPPPEWTVCKEYGRFAEDKVFLGKRSDSRLKYILKVLIEKHNMELNTSLYKWLPDEITDRRVLLTQIKFLFPECDKMPKFAALDYVRDRI